MKGNRKKGKTALHDEEEALTEHELAVVIEAFVTDLQMRLESDVEPFETYLYAHRLKWCKDLSHCITRLDAGYRTLLKETIPNGSSS